MSINVTVTGNPVKIHRGKMVTTSDTLQEADKRRKIRLQQVRQQSKDLAASVRNNVKKVKSKQQTDFDKQNQTKLKEWQNRKLMQLQNEYDETVKDICLTHSQARISECEELEQMERQKIINEARANKRGKVAHELLQIEKNEYNLKKAIPRQAKQIAREVEDARSAMVAHQKKYKSPKKKKKVTKGSFKVVENDTPVVPDSDDVVQIEEDNVEVRDPPIQEEMPNSSLRSPSKHLSVSRSSYKENKQTSVSEGNRSGARTIFSSNEDTVGERVTRFDKSPKKKFRHEDVSLVSINSVEILPDTRISDRIKSRHIVSTQSVMSVIPEGSSSSHTPEDCSNNKENQEHQANINRTVKFSQSTQQGVSIPSTKTNIIACPTCEKHTNPFQHTTCKVITTCPNAEGQSQNICVPQSDGCPNSKPNLGHSCQILEIPSKPSVCIARDTYTPQYSQKDIANTAKSSGQQYRRVRSFDCNNRFSHNYITDTSHVQRIENDDLIYGAHSDCEAGPSNQREFTKIADERAKTAEMRGRKALEKDMIHKDYEELMKKLPILQKQGRIAKLNPAKDKLHMSEERRKMHEQQRQHEMEHAFERLASTRITIPPANRHSRLPKSPKNRSPVRPVSKSTNIAAPKTTFRATSPSNTEGTEDLLELLEKLKAQKEELMKECKDLPEDSNFYNLIDDLDFVARKKAIKNKKVQTQCDVGVGTKKCPAEVKAQKVHKQVLILQNTSTQTSPKINSTSSSTTTESTEPPIKQTKHHIHSRKSKNVCDCKDRDKLCEILIKIRDGSSLHAENLSHQIPEVILRPANRIEDTLDLETAKSRKTTRRKSPAGSDKSISPKRSRSESPKKTPKKVLQANATIKSKAAQTFQPANRIRNDSWKHYLTTSSAQCQDDYTSCTSYYSPPDYNLQGQSPQDKSTRKMSTNLINNNLLQHINKLLEISKDKLEIAAANVSSISEVPTPSSSIISSKTNRPLRAVPKENVNDSTHIEKLSTLLKYFNLTPGDFRSFVTVQSSSSNASRARSNSGCSDFSNVSHSSAAAVGYQGKHIQVTQRSPSHATDEQPSDQITDQFAQWAELCQARISNLTEMINKVRMEKQDMLVTTKNDQRLSPNDRSRSPDNKQNSLEKSNNRSVNSTLEKTNNATSYLNLPPRSNSSSPSLEQAQLNKQLLDIVDGTAAKLPASTRNTQDLQKLLELSKTHPDLDQDMVERYIKLVDVELQAAQRSKSPDKKDPPPFTPLLDIPKLPKFQPQPSTSTATTAPLTRPKKPPVANNALRFNEIFHELSVIPEAETSRLSKSPQRRISSSPQKPLKSPVKTQTSKPSFKQKTQIVTEISSDSTTTDKSNESVESMLKNIGLDWAINTLKKMNAVNNNSSSSSSSLDIDQKKFNLLVSKNVSTSTEQSFVSPLDINLSRHQRTSTPVQNTNSSKSQRSQKLIISGESEISPVSLTGHEISKNKSKSPVSFGPVSFNTMPIESVNEDSGS